jgi:hypothetical protein
MKKILALGAMVLLVASVVVAQTAPKVPKTYQVTGPITALTADVITVQKGDDLWEIGRSKDTKVAGELKIGEKVTIMYRMVAASVEIKAATPEAKKK